MPGKEYPKLPSEGNGWTKWGKHVLAELERQNKCIIKLIDEMIALKIENAVLKMKSGMWGAIGAIIPILIAIIIWLIRSNVLNNSP